MENEFIEHSARRIASEMDRGNVHGAAEELRRDFQTMPPDALGALLQRTNMYDRKGVGGDLLITPVESVTVDQYGRQQIYDTGRRQVSIQSPYGSEYVGQLNARPVANYYEHRGNIDALAGITGAVIGGAILGSIFGRGHDHDRDREREREREHRR